MSVISLLTTALKTAGLVVSKSSRTLAHRRMITLRDVTCVLDVGANTGQYAREIRKDGYRAWIASFEPSASAFAALETLAAPDPKHICHKMALAAASGEGTLIVTQDSTQSSLLRSTGIAPVGAVESHSETVPLARLDAVVPTLRADLTRPFIKIDAQGYELQVLLGARETLGAALAVEIECSLAPLYESQALLPEIWSYLLEHGFRPVWVERGYCDPTSGEMLQIDVLFLAGCRRTAF